MTHVAPVQPNERWSIDFVHDRLATGRAIRVLAIVDDCTRECRALEVDYSRPSARVIAALERAGAATGHPAHLVCDHGSEFAEFASRAFLSWARAQQITLDFIRRWKPVENAYVESFNGKLRDECLNEQYFLDLTDARGHIERWRRNTIARGLTMHSVGSHRPSTRRASRQARNYSYSNRGKVTRCHRNPACLNFTLSGSAVDTWH